MLQVRSSLDVADNTGAKIAWNIGVTGRNQRYAGIGDVIKVHIKVAAPDGTVKKGEVHDAVVVRTRQIIKRAGRLGPAVRQQRLRDHRQGIEPQGHAHFRPGGARAAR